MHGQPRQGPHAFHLRHANHTATLPSLCLMMIGRFECWLSSCCCLRLASALVAYVPFSSSPSYTLYGARGSSFSSIMVLRWCPAVRRERAASALFLERALKRW